MKHIHIGDVEPFRIELLHQDKTQALKVLEEAAEAVEAFKDWNKHGQTAKQRHDLIDECADVIQATVNLMAAMGFTDEEIHQAIEDCRARNDARGRMAPCSDN
ncbi:hypothetical protein [Bifidobacterium aerophilum]|uniref:NTP pyrophosphohydrolase MazG putative catalytic core domain-containing protein n=1 Tax=Bifidobacterium aerophilum TaxID=1798155 RepID=A0A6N9Z3X7_9BIFI|nr:hypothetical protein [Bifidobacterium aerophilum]NEG89288.1 hypothetical protein [Bifidobacterium aerophilum]